MKKKKELEKKAKKTRAKQCALRKSASAGTRRQCSYSDFIFLLEVVGVKSQQAIQHAAAGRPSSLGRETECTECIRTPFTTFIALTCVCVCVGHPHGDKHSCPQVIGMNILSVTLQRVARRSLLIPRAMSDILRQLYGLYLESNCTCSQ